MLRRLHNFLREEIKARRASGLITPDFITECINAASNDLWLELISKERKGVASNLLDPFKVDGTISSGSIASWAGYAIMSVEKDGINALLAESDLVFNKRTPDGIIEDIENIRHLLDDDILETGDNSTASFNLPDNFYEDYKSFYVTVDGTEYEGQILGHAEFLDRKNSSIVITSATQPIARIVADKIEIHPVPATGVSIRVPYMGFPSAKMPIIRAVDSGANKDFTSRPSGNVDGVNVYGYKPPAQANATAGVDPNGVVVLTVSQDLDWTEQAFSHIATRALFYLGQRTSDQQAINQEAQKETVERNAN